MESPRDITAQEVQQRWDKWWKDWQEAEARLFEPILNRLLELARTHGSK